METETPQNRDPRGTLVLDRLTGFGRVQARVVTSEWVLPGE